MLHGIERRSLRRQHRPRIAFDPQQIRAGGRPRAILHQPLDANLGIKRAEKCLGDRQAGDDNRIAAVHHADEPGVRRNDRGRGDVAASAEIFIQRRGDEGVEIESVERKGHGRCLRRLAARENLAGVDQDRSSALRDDIAARIANTRPVATRIAMVSVIQSSTSQSR